ncbi:MAG: HD domain-containing protein [Alphaproteobacteria bacterium]|nr:HD domain-containing protein [Alphaproteobacteria bacterium]
MEIEQINNIINLLGKFKDLKRSGWLQNNVKLPESDADHSFGVAFLVAMLAPKGLDKLKCLELALIHDVAEIYTGDFTPFDDISKDEKHQLEDNAASRIATEIGWVKLCELLKEYNDKSSKEAVFVGLIDKLETAMTSCYYDKNKRSYRVLSNEFVAYAKRHIKKHNDVYVEKIHNIINALDAEANLPS